jgi:hypothetical protein
LYGLRITGAVRAERGPESGVWLGTQVALLIHPRDHVADTREVQSSEPTCTAQTGAYWVGVDDVLALERAK